MKEAESAKTKSKMWEIVNGERRRKRRITTGISEEEWRQYFKNLLGQGGHKFWEKKFQDISRFSRT